MSELNICDDPAALEELRNACKIKLDLFLSESSLRSWASFYRRDKEYQPGAELRSLRKRRKNIDKNLAAKMPDVGKLVYPLAPQSAKEIKKRKIGVIDLLLVYALLCTAVAFVFFHPLVSLILVLIAAVFAVAFLVAFSKNPEPDRFLLWKQRNEAWENASDDCLSRKAKNEFVEACIDFDRAYLRSIGRKEKLETEIEKEERDPTDPFTAICQDNMPEEYQRYLKLKEELENNRFKNEKYPGIVLEILENRLALNLKDARQLAESIYQDRLQQIGETEVGWKRYEKLYAGCCSTKAFESHASYGSGEEDEEQYDAPEEIQSDLETDGFEKMIMEESGELPGEWFD